jgi:cyanophycin synthetase
MEVRDSRRVPGPNLLWDRACAMLDVKLEPSESKRAVDVWRIQARRMLSAVGWGLEETCTRVFAGGANLAISAPIDALYAATEINEWAFAAARAALAAEDPPDLELNAVRLQQMIAQEQKPKLIALRDAARERGVSFITDGEQTSVGSGKGAQVFRASDLPDEGAIDWSAVYDVPIVLVTGTNGKSTTVRLLGSIARACGRVAGLSSTDWIRVDREIVAAGDYSGPEGARRVLRDPRVEIAVLETARGGILRRGLAVRRADAAAITNVGVDHIGEWGVEDFASLVETKFVIERALVPSEHEACAPQPKPASMSLRTDRPEPSIASARPAGTLVLNADDPHLVERARRSRSKIVWFSLDVASPTIAAHTAAAGEAFVLDGIDLLHLRGEQRSRFARVSDLSFTLSGAARHNVANALAASALAHAIGLPMDGIARGLAEFESTPEENPGRLNVFDLGGVRVLADFAHNPHGMEALVEMAIALPARRRLVILGQAGDRDDASIRDLARIAMRMKPDRVVIKEMLQHLRGRSAGAVPKILADELESLGAAKGSVIHASCELDAVRESLRWSQPGDLLLLLLHAQREEALTLLDSLKSRGWNPSDPIPI